MRNNTTGPSCPPNPAALASESAFTEQFVVRYADCHYTVRTYYCHTGTRSLIREVPASARDVAQATMDGRVLDMSTSRP